MKSAPIIRTPGQLPDLRTWMQKQWSHEGAPFVRGYKARAEMMPGAFDRLDWRRQAMWEYDALNLAELWWVSAPMVDLLLATAKGVPDDVMVTDLDPVSPAGLVVFEKPWHGIDTDAPDEVVTVDAMLWSGAHLPPLPQRPDLPLSAQGGIVCSSVSSYRRMNASAGLTANELGLAVHNGLLDLADMEVLFQDGQRMAGDRVRPAIESGDLGAMDPEENVHVIGSLSGDLWVPIGRSDWPFGDRIDREPWPMTDNARLSYVEDRKILAAFWTLVRQEGVTSRTVHRDRAAARRATRAGVPGDSTVQVVTLRRPRTIHPENPDPTSVHTAREWHHRWVVDGHWRWQACGPNRSERRLTFIAPYLKGPEDKPLKTKERVKAWVR